MALFPTQVFSKDNVKCRWKEPYLTDGLNKKFLGIPRGVYLGFEPAPNGVDPINKLDLNLDSTESISVLKVKSLVSPAVVDLVVETQITLDFTGHIAFPVYVYAEASYQVGFESTASIKTSTTPPNGITQIGICKITNANIGGSTLGVDHLQFDPENAPDRHAPIANTGIPFGFMLGGAEQDRQAANASVLEVIAARTDTDAVVWPSLKERIDAVGAELPLTIDLIKSRTYTGVTGSSQIVSGDFADTSRASVLTLPYKTFDSGSESAPGVITNADTFGRNLVGVRDKANGKRVIDLVTGSNVYGRLIYLPAALAGTFNFMNGSASVTASASQTGVVDPGDIILAPDESYYRVTAIDGPGTGLTLEVGYTGPTTLNAPSVRRRFTVNLVKRVAGVESAYSVVRSALILTTFGVGTAFQAGETITYNGKTGVVVFEVNEGDDTLYYIPTVASSLILANELIVGGTSLAQVNAIPGTPTSAAPDFEFFYPAFQDLTSNRYSALLDFLHGAGDDAWLASEGNLGVVQLAASGDTTPGLAIQAHDQRILTINEAAAAQNAASPSAANPFVTQNDFDVLDACAKATAYIHFEKTGVVVPGSGYARTVYLFTPVAGREDAHSSQASIASVTGQGEITLTRPPAGIVYHYTVRFISSDDGAGPPNTQHFVLRRVNVTTNYSNVANGNIGGGTFQMSMACVMTVAVDEAPGVLPNLFEVVDLGSVGPPDDAISRLEITRTARPA